MLFSLDNWFSGFSSILCEWLSMYNIDIVYLQSTINEKMKEMLNTIPMPAAMSYQSELDRLTATDNITQFPTGFIYG